MAKFDPPNSRTMAKLIPITLPSLLKSGPPEPPEVVWASYTILSGSTSPMCPWVVVGLIRLRRASSSITCLGSPLDAVAMDCSVSVPARARIASRAVGYPRSTTGPPLTADRRLSARAICLILRPETFPFTTATSARRRNPFGVDRNAIRNAREICRHLRNHRLNTLIEHFFQVVILPPWFGNMMIGKNSSVIRDEKAGAENVQVHFGATPGKAYERVVVLIGGWLTAACHRRVAQSRSGSVLAESEHNMDETNARLIGLDDSLGKFAFGLDLPEAVFYHRQLSLQRISVLCLVDRNLRPQVLTLLLQFEFLRIARRRWTVILILKSAT